jgi:hypothetical protein
MSERTIGNPQQPVLSTLRLSLLLFVAIWSFYAIVGRSYYVGGDDQSYMAISVGLVTHGKPVNPDGSFSKYSLGQSLINLPAVAASMRAKDGEAERDLVKYTSGMYWMGLWSAALAALQVVVFFHVLIALRLDRRSAIVSALLYGGASMLVVYSRRLFADTTLALTWLTCLLAILLYRRNGATRWVAVCGGSAGFSLLLKPYAPLVTGILVLYAVAYLVYTMRRPADVPRRAESRDWLALIGPIVLCIGCALWYNAFRYGDILQFGYHEDFDRDRGFTSPLLTGLTGQLLSPGKGVFWYNPLLILTLWGWRDMGKRNRGVTTLTAVILVVFIGVMSMWAYWPGQWSWGPRFMTNCLPFLFLPVAFFVATRVFNGGGARRPLVAVVALLAGISIFVQSLGLVASSNEYADVITECYPEYNIRNDDTFRLPFKTEFSPLGGHLWMIRCMLNRQTERGTELRQTPPFASIDPDRPIPPHITQFKANVWWMYAWQIKHPHRVRISIFALLWALLAIAAVWRALRELPTGEARVSATDSQ